MKSAGKPENLTPWKPGQSGNPAGSSRKARERAYLRDALAEVNAEILSEDEMQRLQLRADGLRRIDAIARRLSDLALFGDVPELLNAISRIQASEPKQHEVEASHSGSVEGFSESQWAEFASRFDRIKSCGTEIAARPGNGSGNPSNGSGDSR